MEQPNVEEPILPRLMASNALRANLSKHMTLNQMADHKASMIMTASPLMLTISVTQYDKLDPTFEKSTPLVNTGSPISTSGSATDCGLCWLAWWSRHC